MSIGYNPPENGDGQVGIAYDGSGDSAGAVSKTAEGGVFQSTGDSVVTNSLSYASQAKLAQIAAEEAQAAAEASESNAASSEESASTSAATATSKATEAAASALVANGKAIQALESAVASQGWASNSEASATAAASSETSAAASAAAAAGSEAGVEADALAAEAAKIAAQAAQAAAETAETNAETAETNAETSETNAAASASSASTSASTATTQAGNASTSASNAADSATAASTSASSAATSATSAATSAGTATTKASEASSSATAAASSATDAETAQTAAEAAQAAAEDVFEQFGDQYLGSFATDPTVDNSGNPLTEGDIYWNSTDSVLKFYSGTAWVAPEVIATTAATDAAESQQAAAISENNAFDSAFAASTSETNAAASAATAATEASDSAGSATNAEASATSASSSATAASNSAAAASGSATAASSSATAAGTAQTAAEAAQTAAEAAQAAAEAAEDGVAADAAEATSAASAASTSEINAAASASAASDSETAAAASASAASTSETNSEASASSALGSASAASTSATEAGDSATAAASSATAASNSETAAEAAQTAAEAAEAGVEADALAAASSASAAATSASDAAGSALAAEGSATAASTSESNAATSESNAASSATSAAGSATSASDSAIAAAASLDSFDDLYLGQKSTSPTVDNDGDPLITGALYFDTTDEIMKVWTGTSWLSAYASLSGALIASNNLSDLSDAAAARTNLDLGSLDDVTFASATIDSLQFTGGTGTQGTMSWNADEETVDLQLNDVTLQLGQESVFYGKAVGNIPNGAPVMFAGAQGGHLLITVADMSLTGFIPEYVVGVATETITNNNFGFVTSFGKVRGLNTSGYNEGDLLYLDPDNAGQYVTSLPSAPDHGILVAAVTRSHANNGTILVRVSSKPDLTELCDVEISSPSDNELLVYNGINLRWENQDLDTTGIATKEYVDTVAAASIHYHTPCRVESPGSLTATYNNGTAGVGATLTNSGTQAALVIDGITMVVDDRVLLYEQTDATQNGIYTVTNVGSGSTNWVLTRATDADSSAASDPDALGAGDAFFITEGATGAGELYVMNTAGTITFGTTDITFAQISSAQIYTDGTGIDITGVTISLDAASQTSLSRAETAFGWGDHDGLYALLGHGHVISDVTGLQTALDGKVDDSQVLTNVPSGAVFTDTTYSVGNGGLTQINFTSALNSKLAGIEANANNYVLPFTNNSTNWNTAYSWGNHASAGYAAASSLSNYLPKANNSDYQLQVWDNRNTDTSTDLGQQAAVFEFKANSTDSLSDGGTYHGVLTLQQWSDTSGGNTHQLAFTNNGNLHLRSVAIGGTWPTNWSKLWHSNNDGSGSGLDADLLDGQQGSYYAAASSLGSYLPKAGGTMTGTLDLGTQNINVDTNKGFVNSGSWTRNQTPFGYIDLGPANTNHAHIYTDRPNFYFNKQIVINGATVWNSNNDGSGSGLDADLLDGQHASAFEPANDTILKSGSIITNQDWNTYVDGTEASWNTVSNHSGANRPSSAYTYGTALSFATAGAARFQLYAPETSSSGGTTAGLWYRTGWNANYRPWVRVWDSGNDGSGSGLDADLLDGQQGTYYLNTSTNHGGDITGTYNNLQIASNRVGANELNVSGNGTAGQMLTSDGDGSMSWADAASGGGGGITYIRKTANYTASAGEGIIADTSGGTFTVTLPSSPSLGDVVIVGDGNNWSTTNLTVGRNGSTIDDVADDMLLDVAGVSVEFVYDGTTWLTYVSAGEAGLQNLSDDTTPTLGGDLTTVGSDIFISDNDRVRFGNGGGESSIYSNGTHTYWDTASTAKDIFFRANTTSLFLMNMGTGDFHAEGDVVAASTSVSDRKLKENIVNIDNALDKVQKLNGVNYNWKKTGKADTGLIAQEVQEVLPNIVKEVTRLDGEECLAITYAGVIGLLVEAVKELKAEVEVLKNGS